jgi:hypothetical protein
MNRSEDDRPDASDGRGSKFRRAIDTVQQGYSDRWPARGTANTRTGEWPPLEDVSRQGKLTEYLKRPSAKR